MTVSCFWDGIPADAAAVSRDERRNQWLSRHATAIETEVYSGRAIAFEPPASRWGRSWLRRRVIERLRFVLVFRSLWTPRNFVRWLSGYVYSTDTNRPRYCGHGGGGHVRFDRRRTGRWAYKIFNACKTCGGPR